MAFTEIPFPELIDLIQRTYGITDEDIVSASPGLTLKRFQEIKRGEMIQTGELEQIAANSGFFTAEQLSHCAMNRG